MKKMINPVLYTILMLITLSSISFAQDASIFPLGELGANVHHTGKVWLNELVKADSALNCSVAVATFGPTSKLDWHNHPGGQILLITEGIGFYQEKDKPVLIVQKGDVIKCLPGVEHWHGSSPGSGFTYIAVNTNITRGKTIWSQKVTDKEYNSIIPPVVNNAKTEQEIIDLSKTKWRWMSERKVDSLATLFDEKAVFVHMGGTMSTQQELDIIKSGGIHYKDIDIQETSVQFVDNTAILLNKIKLVAVVGGNEVTNPFVVTEVYILENGKWSLGSMSFTRLLTQ